MADLRDAESGIHGMLFIRDNMFRALAFFDQDYSRHIEGGALRLHWDAPSLFHLVAQRLRVALQLPDVESDVKVWNRFAQRGVHDVDGFRRCLQNTLYRPRDVLILLNQAFQMAKREGRDSITDADVDATARQVSESRLDDLHKEYNRVFPGLRYFTNVFRAKLPTLPVGEAIALLQRRIDEAEYVEESERDFAILGSGQQVFFALYSIGFLGLCDSGGGGYTFCHDGTATDLGSLPLETQAIVHPCYWRALEIAAVEGGGDAVLQINDEYEVRASPETADQRTRLLGEIVGEIGHIPEGREAYDAFEQWVLKVLPVLFAGNLANFARHPNADGMNRRDIVAACRADNGVWRRLREDYGSRQVVFEVKNYAELKHDDVRQMIDYLTGEYGRFGVIVTRSPNEYLSSSEKGWIKAAYFEHSRFIVIMSAQMLARGVRKRRSPRRQDYMEEAVQKLLDYYIRSVFSLKHERSFRKKRRRK